MMKYYTFVVDDNKGEKDKLVAEMSEYLEQAGIKFNLGADFLNELIPFGYDIKQQAQHTVDIFDLAYTFIILGHEADLSAIQLHFGNITIIENRLPLKIKNYIRGLFDWVT